MAGPEKWYFTREKLMNSPSRKCGFDADRELAYRQQAANLIQDMGQRLQVSQLCINTAIVYMHRFYAFHSFTHFHRNSIAAAALFLAAKVEEQPRKLEYVIKVAHMCLHRSDGAPTLNVNSEQYQEQAQDLVFNENVLLQTLGFDVAIDHPHTHVLRTCQLVKAPRDLVQTSYFMASNSLHLTTMCLQHKPTVVACFCIHLASKWSNWAIPQSYEGRHWFYYVDRSVTTELLESLTSEFLNIFDKYPSKLKKRMMSLNTAAAISSPHSGITAQQPLEGPSGGQQTPLQPPVASSPFDHKKITIATITDDAERFDKEYRHAYGASQGSLSQFAHQPPVPNKLDYREYREKKEREERERRSQHNSGSGVSNSGAPRPQQPHPNRHHSSTGASSNANVPIPSSSHHRHQSWPGQPQHHAKHPPPPHHPSKPGQPAPRPSTSRPPGSHHHHRHHPSSSAPATPMPAPTAAAPSLPDPATSIPPQISDPPRQRPPSLFSPENTTPVAPRKPATAPPIPQQNQIPAAARRTSSVPPHAPHAPHPPPQPQQVPLQQPTKPVTKRPPEPVIRDMAPPPPLSPFLSPPAAAIVPPIQQITPSVSQSSPLVNKTRMRTSSSSSSEPELVPVVKKLEETPGYENIIRDSQRHTAIRVKPERLPAPSPPRPALNGIETDPVMVSSLLKESLSRAPPSNLLTADSANFLDKTAEEANHHRVHSNIVTAPVTAPSQLFHPPSIPESAVSRLVPEPETANEAVPAVPKDSLQGAYHQQHHHRSEKKKKKEKHKHKDRDKDKSREERKKHKKDKDKEKKRTAAGIIDAPDTAHLVTSDGQQSSLAAPIKITIPRDKLAASPSSTPGFKIKIPKDRIERVPTTVPAPVAVQQLQPSIPAPQQLHQSPAAAIKIKISKDVLEGSRKRSAPQHSEPPPMKAPRHNGMQHREKKEIRKMKNVPPTDNR